MQIFIYGNPETMSVLQGKYKVKPYKDQEVRLVNGLLLEKKSGLNVRRLFVKDFGADKVTFAAGGYIAVVLEKSGDTLYKTYVYFVEKRDGKWRIKQRQQPPEGII